jgi:DNA-binding NtrC family response regulator
VGLRIVITDVSLRQIVRSLVECRIEPGAQSPKLLIVELNGQKDCKGAAAIREVRSGPASPVIIAISRADCAAITQQAVRLGINDYFRLPEESADLKAAIGALLEGSEAPAKTSTQHSALVGDSPPMISLRRYISRIAMTDSSVLITGETGTGKELVAEEIHKSGARRSRPFVCVNSAALPEALIESELFGFEKGAFTGAQTKYAGKLRMAHSGTIFFDEIGDLNLSAQAKLLRALESGEVHPLGGWRGVNVDVRVIAATNRDVDGMSQTGEFRRDLFYRLNVVRIALPPLRGRREDIPLLLAHFIAIFNERMGRQVEAFDPEVVELLQSYDWPGNIRELKNAVEASFVNAVSGRIELMDVPENLRCALEAKLDPGSRQKLVRTLHATNWNISRAAGELQCSRMTIYRKMAHYSISRAAV